MAGPFSHRKLDLGRDLFAQRAFNCAGRNFERGDVLEWRRLAVSERLVGQLWDQGYLDNEAPLDQSVFAPIAATRAAVAAEPEPDPDPDVADAAPADVDPVAKPSRSTKRR